MKKFFLRIMPIIFIAMIIFVTPLYGNTANPNSVSGGGSSGGSGSSSGSGGSSMRDAWNAGGNWFQEMINRNDPFSTDIKNQLLEDGGIIDTIKTIGYGIIFITGVILGGKYVISGAEGKAFVKDNLVTYSIGVVFYYFADEIFTFFRNSVLMDLATTTEIGQVTGNIYATVSTIATTICVLAVMYYGVKYMFENDASKKAEMKKSIIPIIVGAILILCIAKFVTFVYNVANDALPDDVTYMSASPTENVRVVEMEDYNTDLLI